MNEKKEVELKVKVSNIDRIKELKVMGYDNIAQIEAHKRTIDNISQNLAIINQEIIDLSKKDE